MKLKGLVWFFAITLILISIFQLSFTWVVNSHEKQMELKAERQVKSAHPEATSDEQKDLIRMRLLRLLDSTKETKIYPVLGTTYQKCKENELNLGLDLQGGMSVTMDVSLEGLIRSYSNNPKDPQLLKAIAEATRQKVNSNENYIDLFQKAFEQQNPGVKLSSLFAGAGKKIKINDNNETVINEIKAVSKGAINQTYKILLKRIDKFGVAQPNINLDENKGIITVELAGVHDPERVRKYLQSSANLQFWEVYNIGDLDKQIEAADKALQNYLNGVTPVKDTTAKLDSTKKASDTTAKADTTKAKANDKPLISVVHFIAPQQDKSGKQYFPAALANVELKDTGKVNEYLSLEVVKNSFPPDVKFLYGVEEKDEKGVKKYLPLYAIRTIPGSDKAKLEGDGVEDSRQDYDERGKPAIKMQMTPMGSRIWAKLTEDNKGKPIAIVLDDIVYSAPNVIDKIEGGNSEISGSFSIDEAQDLANILKSGKLDAPAKIVQEQIVGPTLGQEAVNGGAKSFAISFLVIFILMLIYYNTAGWVANIALILNLLFTIGILSALSATLTAAGIAGLVLTIGMAVDTNVIIFERIKEELARGKNYVQAVSDGYKRSLAPVIDAHVTTFLTAAILFYFGLGPVLGFATTQMLGISLSLFCGILLSRLVTDLWTNKQRHFTYFTGVSKKIFKHASFKFIEYRKVAYGISIVVLLLGVGSFFNGFKLGVEFKGGRSYTVHFEHPVKNDEIRNQLKDAFGGQYPEIKTVGDSKHLNITTAFMKGDNRDTTETIVKTHLFEGLKQAKAIPQDLTYASFISQNSPQNNIQASQVVQPTISEDLKAGAIKATIFAIIAIFLYIFIRFRDWRYSLGTIIALLHDVFVTLAVFSFFKDIVPFPLEIDQYFIAAILTVIGFSMNDTVIVFDRIREYSRTKRGATKTVVINTAINDTLSRTIMTSMTVFLTLLILFIFGGEVTRGFAFAMLVGVITGTYSSIFVAAPILVDFAKDRPLGEADLTADNVKKAKPVVAKA
jgi:SecD/SecF fusion protein